MLLDAIKSAPVREGIREALGHRAHAKAMQDEAELIIAEANEELETLVLAAGANTIEDPALGSVSLSQNTPRKSVKMDEFTRLLAESGVSIDIIARCKTKATHESVPEKPVSVRYTPPKG